MYIKSHNTVKIWVVFNLSNDVQANSEIILCSDLLNTFGATNAFTCDGFIHTTNCIDLRLTIHQNVLKCVAYNSFTKGAGIVGFIEYAYNN